MRVPWTARRSTQPILKEINPEYSLKGLMLRLKLQHFGHLMRRAILFEKTLKLGKIEGKRRRGQQRIRQLDGITKSMDMNLSKLWEIVGKESACSMGDPRSVPGWARFPGEGNGHPLQYSCLENPMDRGAWWDIIYGVTKSQA